jgi:glutamine cyclotransferase
MYLSKPFIALSISSVLLLGYSCKDTKEGNTGTPNPEKTAKVPPRKQAFRLVSPDKKNTLIYGEQVVLEVAAKDSTVRADSVSFFMDGKLLATFRESPYRLDWKASGLGVGKHRFSFTAFYPEKARESQDATFEIFSDLEPERFRYRTVKDFPHDKRAWTQGLFYHNGFFYEGTGQLSASFLRKVEISTGKVLQQHALAGQYFGEGIALHNSEIFQLTWQTQRGFVYDAATFQVKREFTYPTEGWGLTSNGTHLIMSDGSHQLFFMDPASFTEVRRIQVYSNKGAVVKLNELEYIQGKIWANVWETDQIVIIDPQSGKVTGIIDLSNIIDKSNLDSQAVLNGIAYDEATGRIFVTGKWWPKVFQIEVVPVS